MKAYLAVGPLLLAYNPLHFLFIPLGGAISRSTAAMVNVKAPGESHPQFLRETYQGHVEEDQADADIVKVLTAQSVSLEELVFQGTVSVTDIKAFDDNNMVC